MTNTARTLKYLRDMGWEVGMVERYPDRDENGRFKKGHKTSEEIKRKISEKLMGRKLSKERRRKISEGNKGRISYWRDRPIPKEVREKMSQSRMGHPTSKATRKKISKALMGKHLSQEAKNKLRKVNLGKHHSEKTRKKIGRIVRERNKKMKEKFGYITSLQTRRKMSKARKGPKSSNWKGGITSKNKEIRQGIEFRLWREAVFARDNWICQRCNKKGEYLHPHHIKNFADYPELRFAIDNGITLCKKCHLKFHKIYGYNHNTKKQLKEFLT